MVFLSTTINISYKDHMRKSALKAMKIYRSLMWLVLILNGPKGATRKLYVNITYTYFQYGALVRFSSSLYTDQHFQRYHRITSTKEILKVQKRATPRITTTPNCFLWRSSSTGFYPTDRPNGGRKCWDILVHTQRCSGQSSGNL